MAEKLTPQQELAVKDRGGKLLVSAAAGSGKTKVLVDRLLGYLMDPQDPADLDSFLIITYTKAAASELRGKIAAKLSEKMAQMPDNRHLQRQMQRLYLTKISTVHGFCGDILREYAYMLDIPADFRVADENECRQLRDTCMAQMLETVYEEEASDPDFRAFVDTQGLGRDDRLIPEILLKVYDSARCHLDPEQWLDKCIQNADVSALEDAAQTDWGKYLMEDLAGYLDLQIEAMEACVKAAEAAEGMEKPALLLRDTAQQLRMLRACDTWDEVVRNKDLDYGRLLFSKKCPDQELGERIKAVRNACKKGLEKKLRNFADPSAVVFEDLQSCARAVRGMVKLVRRFAEQYDRMKRSFRVLDFGDLEHKCLDLLQGRRRIAPTVAANEIGKRFREIMVDEYQDSNAVQDAIFSALTAERQNCFMVGDVKQSIYQFRLADPKIFLEKYQDYVPAEQAKPGEGRKVLLSSNFRSGGGVLAGVNDIFRLCMSERVGSLVYGPEEALNEGVPHVPLGEAEVELCAVQVTDSTYDEEAAFVAKKIRELLNGSHFVRQKDTLRPIQPEDIAILLRSPGSVGEQYRRALAALGIRCVSGGGENLLEREEIAAVRSLLQVISNPRQDIPLIAVLVSPMFGFTADDLAQIRGNHRSGCIYEALQESKSEKAIAFLAALERLRQSARLHTLARLLEEIFSVTKLDSICAAMDGGNLRSSNLQTFYRLAVDFESNGRRDLEQFLEHLQAMEEKGLIAAGEQTAVGAVTLMSIHKSKGLEFPVVIVSGLSREFNRESQRAQVLCHKELGLGLSAVDEKNRVRYPTVAKRAIGAKIAEESLSEEMRVLYVALTRARDRLIMTYAQSNLESDLQSMVAKMDMSSMELLTRDVVCPGQWVLLAALKRTEAGQLFKLGGKPEHTQPGSPAWAITVDSVAAGSGESALIQPMAETMPAELPEKLQKSLSFRYPHMAATLAPSKQTATQRKGRDKDEEAAQDTQILPQHRWRKPAFGKKTVDGKEYGTAVHSVMQHLDFSGCGTEDSICRQVEDMASKGLLSPELAAGVDCRTIADFFATELGQKLQTAKEILREFKFSVLDAGENYDPRLQGEQILLQGVVDCALMEEDGITVVDFKTDYVTEETLSQRAEHYRPQVRSYADALGRIYKKPVKQAVLYFFRLRRFVRFCQ